MLKIKLAPRGKIHQITYRIVVAQDRSKLNGPAIDDLGFYTPQTKTIQIDKEKMAQWIKNGAFVTVGVDKLLNPDKYPNKHKKVKEKKVKEEKPQETPVETKPEEVKEESSQEIKTEEKNE